MIITPISAHYSETISMNHTHYKGAHNFPLHTHEVEEMVFLRKGNAFYHVDGISYPFSKNCLILSHPSKSHSISFDVEYDRYVVLFDAGKFSSRIFDHIPADISVIDFGDDMVVSNLFQKMDYYCENFDGIILENVLLHLIEETLYNAVITLRRTEQNSAYSIHSMVNKAVAYIDKNITASLTIDAICKELFISKAYLHQIFMKHMQISPKKYITSQKLMLAQKELRAGKKSTEVYLSCGFSDYSTFFRDYKKYFGHAPSNEINAKIVHEIQS